MSGEVTIQLTKSIKVHGQDVDTITLREPTVEDEIDLGQPFLIVPTQGNKSGISVQAGVLAQYLVRLAGIQMTSVKQMTRSDFSKASAAVMGFFGADESDQPSS